MSNLPLLPISRSAPSNASSTVNPATPIVPVSGQPYDQTFSEVLRNAGQESVTEEQDGISIESIVMDESNTKTLLELPVKLPTTMSAIIAPVAPSNAMINPAMPPESVIPSSTVRPEIRAFMAAQSDFLADHPTSSDTMSSEWVADPFSSISFKPGQPVFAEASSLKMETPIIGLAERLSYIDEIIDHPTNLGDGSKLLPPSNSTTSSSSAAANSVSISAFLGEPAWPDEFSQKITWLATQRLQMAELKLHPAHLGPVEVLLKITNEQGVQQLTAQFVSQNPLVRETIEANLPRLRETMAESGIILTDTSVGADTPRQDARNPQQRLAQSSPSDKTSNRDGDSIDIRQASGQMAVSHMGIINTFA